MTCPHDITERDVAVSADGYCPLCQAIEIKQLKATLRRLKIALKEANLQRLPRKNWKQEARYTANKLKQNGILKPTICADCGFAPKPFLRTNGRKQSVLEMHHPDHERPELVVWLCMACHHKAHGQNCDLSYIHTRTE
jgi:hypothetical protein